MFWLAIPGVASLVIFLSSCNHNRPLNTLTSDASPDAKKINDLFFVVLGIATVVGVLVLGAIVYMIWRFRNREKNNPYDPDNPNLALLEAEALPEQTHGNLRLEIAWTIIPALILLVVAIFTLFAIFEQHRSTAADDQLKVDVVGQQWWWEFQYHIDGDRSTPPDFVSANELVIPTGQQIPLEVSARDVIHAFWIPRLNGKIDAVPGREHAWRIEASKPGTYKGQCTEFCGLSHGFMKMEVRALETSDWASWARNQMRSAAVLSADDPNYEGQELFITNCARCHSISGVTDTNADNEVDTWEIYDGDGKIHDQLISGSAPNLTHFASRTTYAGSIFDTYLSEVRIEDYLRLSLTEASATSVGEGVGDEVAPNIFEPTPDIRGLRRWIFNAPAEKPAAASESRGMPAFPNLTTDQVNSVIDYLLTLK